MQRTIHALLTGLIAALLLPAATAGGVEHDLVERALAAMDTGDETRWAFTETTVQDGKTVVQRHDPTLPAGERWTLVSVDGREPTDDERKKLARPERPEGEGPEEDGGIRAMIGPGGVTLVDETPTHATFAFEPVAEDEEDRKLYEHLDATLRVTKEGPYVDRVELTSVKPFSPGFGMKIKEFSMRMTFAPAEERPEILPHEVSLRIRGRAMLVKKFEQETDITYGEYRYVGD